MNDIIFKFNISRGSRVVVIIGPNHMKHIWYLVMFLGHKNSICVILNYTVLLFFF